MQNPARAESRVEFRYFSAAFGHGVVFPAGDLPCEEFEQRGVAWRCRIASRLEGGKILPLLELGDRLIEKDRTLRYRSGTIVVEFLRVPSLNEHKRIIPHPAAVFRVELRANCNRIELALELFLKAMKQGQSNRGRFGAQIAKGQPAEESITVRGVRIGKTQAACPIGSGKKCDHGEARGQHRCPAKVDAPRVGSRLLHHGKWSVGDRVRLPQEYTPSFGRRPGRRSIRRPRENLARLRAGTDRFQFYRTGCNCWTDSTVWED